MKYYYKMNYRSTKITSFKAIPYYSIHINLNASKCMKIKMQNSCESLDLITSVYFRKKT